MITVGSRASKQLVPPSLIDRYFSLHYAVNAASRFITDNDPKQPQPRPQANPHQVQQSGDSNPTGLDVCVARHHNGLCMICISPRHPIITEKDTVTDVEYRVPFREVQGKRKRGGILVEDRTKLCILTCASGNKYKVQCAIRGVIVEYNSVLEKSPSLINAMPLRNGYLAAVLPFQSEIKTAVDKLVTHSNYEIQLKDEGR